MDPFHDEAGYLLWDKANGQVVRCFAVPRGPAILVGGDAEARERELTFRATPGSEDYGLCQNKHLLHRARATAFESTFTFNDDGTFSYTSDLVLKLAATGEDRPQHAASRQAVPPEHRDRLTAPPRDRTETVRVEMGSRRACADE
jgi:hypothetical protein